MHFRFAQRQGKQHRADGQQQPLRNDRCLRVENSKDQQAGGIVGDCQQQKKGDRRMPHSKDHSRHQVAECDVRCAGHRPALSKRLTRSGQVTAGDVDQGGTHDTAKCGKQGGGRFPRIGKCAAWQERFPHFLGRDRKKQGHQDIVDDEMDASIHVDQRAVHRRVLRRSPRGPRKTHLGEPRAPAARKPPHGRDQQTHAVRSPKSHRNG